MTTATAEGRRVVPGARIRLGMVGGGEGAFIGAVHRMAARLDDRYDLVAGALSSDPATARASGTRLRLDPGRTYTDFRDMAAREAERADGIDAVAVVVPNHLHAPVVRAFLDVGIHVICDKPLCRTDEEATDLAARVAASGRVFALTHAFTGYPMVRQAREMVASGQLGAIRLVEVEYVQGWLADRVEDDPAERQAGWRVDPEKGGAGGCLGDIGTHAFHLAEHVSGLRVHAVAADLSTFVPGRQVVDNAHLLVRFDGEARGSMWLTQVATGAGNGLRLRVVGERCSLAWDQEHPDELEVSDAATTPTTLRRGAPALGPAATRSTRVPLGHPEGYLEAFAQIYTDAAEAISAWPDPPDPAVAAALPGIDDGLRGMAFVSAALASGAADAAWRTLPELR